VRLEHYDHPFGADLASPGQPVEWRSKAPPLGGGEDDFFAPTGEKIPQLPFDRKEQGGRLGGSRKEVCRACSGWPSGVETLLGTELV
jgi:hypothetical protein